MKKLLLYFLVKMFYKYFLTGFIFGLVILYLFWFNAELISGFIVKSTFSHILITLIFVICLISGFIANKGNEGGPGRFSGIVFANGFILAYLISYIIRHFLFSTSLSLLTLISAFSSAILIGYLGGRAGELIRKITNKIKEKPIKNF